MLVSVWTESTEVINAQTVSPRCLSNLALLSTCMVPTPEDREQPQVKALKQAPGKAGRLKPERQSLERPP